LEKQQVEAVIVEHVCRIIANVSFKGAGVDCRMESLEGMIVQDADRLDALGAIGIARTFAYGGFKGQPLYDPEIRPEYHRNFEEYKKSQGSTINHFYEKLLLLKDQMNTATARQIAESRTEFMMSFLNRFHEEWLGEDLSFSLDSSSIRN
jgi:uncharacterized protein